MHCERLRDKAAFGFSLADARLNPNAPLSLCLFGNAFVPPKWSIIYKKVRKEGEYL